MKATSVRYKTSLQDDWVARFAQKERQSNELRSRQSARGMHQRDVQLHRLRNAITRLKDRVAHDVESLDREFPDPAIRVENTPTGDGFVVRREHYPEVRLTVTPHLADCSVHVDYLAAPKMRKLVLAASDGFMWVFLGAPRHGFRTAAELSEYLLVPVVTGQLV